MLIFIWLFVVFVVFILNHELGIFIIRPLVGPAAVSRLSAKPPREGAGLWRLWFSCGYGFLKVPVFLITSWKLSSPSLAPRRTTRSPRASHKTIQAWFSRVFFLNGHSVFCYHPAWHIAGRLAAPRLSTKPHREGVRATALVVQICLFVVFFFHPGSPVGNFHHPAWHCGVQPAAFSFCTRAPRQGAGCGAGGFHGVICVSLCS